MLIDWFTVIAQIVNFLILLGLLKYFLFDRIIQAMDQREERIRSRMEDAEEKNNRAEHEKKNYEQKNRELEEQKQQLLSEAREEAEKRKKELLGQAKAEVDSSRKKWREALQKEKESFLQNLNKTVSHEVYAISRRMVSDLANSNLNEQVVETFTNRLASLQEDEKQKILDSLEDSQQKVEVYTAFDLSENLQNRIADTVHKEINGDVELSFASEPQLGIGAELRVKGHRVGWNAQQYLDELEKHTEEILQKKTYEQRQEEETSREEDESTENTEPEKEQ